MTINTITTTFQNPFYQNSISIITIIYMIIHTYIHTYEEMEVKKNRVKHRLCCTEKGILNVLSLNINESYYWTLQSYLHKVDKLLTYVINDL